MKALQISILLISLFCRYLAFEADAQASYVEGKNTLNFDLVKVAQDRDESEESPASCETRLSVAYEHKYMGFIFVGSSQQAVNVTFDTASPQVVITSELCDNTCQTKAYSQSKSTTSKNLGETYELEYDFEDILLETVAFSDNICLQSNCFCVPEQEFYAIASQKGLLAGEEGIVGLAPIPADGDRGDSFILELKRLEVIDQAMFSIYISKSPDVVSHSLMIGDWNRTLVAEGEEIEFYSLSGDGSSWAIDVTDAKYGNTVIISDWQEWAILDTNLAGIGLIPEHFAAVASVMTESDPTIFCDDRNCLGMNRCEDYKGQLDDLELTFNRRKTYTVSGDRLLLNIPMDGYRCLFGLYGSQDGKYHLGDVLLGDYYTVYDLENYKVGLAKARVFDDQSQPEIIDDGSARRARENLVANLLIFSSAVLVIALVLFYWHCKKKRQQAPNHRFPLIDDYATNTGSFADTHTRQEGLPEGLHFIERTAEEREGDEEQEDEASADPNATVQANEQSLNYNE